MHVTALDDMIDLLYKIKFSDQTGSVLRIMVRIVSYLTVSTIHNVTTITLIDVSYDKFIAILSLKLNNLKPLSH